MLPDILKLENMGGEPLAMKKAVEGGKSSAVFFTCQTARYHLTAGIDRFFLFVAPDSLSARLAQEALADYTGEETVLVTEREEVLLNTKNTLLGSLRGRLSALASIYKGSCRGAVVTAEGLTRRYPSIAAFSASLIEVKKNDTLDLTDLAARLAAAGYKREDTVAESGQFAVRGDILDVWPGNTDMPVRIDFFGDTVESVRYFAPESMMSIKEIKNVVITPKSDIIVSQKGKEGALKRLESIKKNTAGRLNEVITEVIEKLENDPSDPSLVWILPFVTQETSSIFDYLPKNAVVVFDEIKTIDDKIKLAVNAHAVRVKSFVEAGEATAFHIESLFPREALYTAAKQKTILAYQQITSSNPVFEPEALFNIKALAVTRYNLNFNALVSDVKGFTVNGAKVYIFAGSPDTANAVRNFLFENGIGGKVTDDPNEKHDVLIFPRRIARGFNYPAHHIVVIGTDDISRRTETAAKSDKKKKNAFLIPVKGDYVVHETHGIGISEGVETVDTKYGKKDFYVVLYKGGDKLYLPVDKMDSLEKYTGGGTPMLHKLGGKEFERIKERVKNSVKELAIDLVSLYEKRLSLKGHRYQPDTVWQKELEDAFEYDETDDQLIAISEIKEDMEKGKVMDRLLCGDVGFGKTEVAIRAIFKTVIEGKQAAILSPTTILCQQHYNTINARFKPFGIQVDVLSRFVSEDYIRGALERIKSGKTGVVVATHRILSKDVGFHDLGLLVLDEEQRFGVEHKEQIKLLKNNVNVLSLSATPIPRTLHMALSGIRDISTLETPPRNRLPVQTYVVEYSDALMKDAITRELARGGQVFVLFNRVRGIESFFSHVKDLVPEASVVYAHGQMESGELEERIRAFYNKEANVLVSTTIIENGIDLPDANTLIVIDSDRLGLSELYQLRGRVGRSFNLAYSYFTVKEGKVLTENAEKRLNALLNYTELGSGFKIAMQDMEIRGAGNVLGREQHGNMEKVGYDMYCRLLNEAVGELKGVLPVPVREVEIIAEGDFTLPQEYIRDGERRVRFYKEVAAVSTPEERDAFLQGLTEAYGKPPASVVNLADIGLIKNLASALNIKKINASDEGIGITFYDSAVFKNENVFRALDAMKKDAVLTPTNPPVILFNNKGKKQGERLNVIKKFLLASTSQRG